MTNIYKCAIFETQKISFKSIKELINNDAELKRNILPKIEKKIGDIDTSEKKINCIPNDANTKNSVIKLKVLRETTYELCHYISYLEYLRDYNSDYANIWKQEAQNNTVLNDPKNAGTAGLANTLSTSSGSYNLTAIIELEKKKKSQIDDEIKHSYKIFPIAFNVYNQYEENMTIHILL